MLTYILVGSSSLSLDDQVSHVYAMSDAIASAKDAEQHGKPTFILFVCAHTNQVIYLSYHVSLRQTSRRTAALAYFGSHGSLLYASRKTRNGAIGMISSA